MARLLRASRLGLVHTTARINNFVWVVWWVRHRMTSMPSVVDSQHLMDAFNGLPRASPVPLEICGSIEGHGPVARLGKLPRMSRPTASRGLKTHPFNTLPVVLSILGHSGSLRPLPRLRACSSHADAAPSSALPIRIREQRATPICASMGFVTAAQRSNERGAEEVPRAELRR